MATRDRLTKIRKILRRTYPDVKTQLDHENPFQLLIATILSAQCTDRQVNRVTGALFQAYGTPAKLSAAPLKQIENLIHSTGFYRNKARNIISCARALVEAHGGEVPADQKALTGLPGVGRKTANVVLGAAFGIPGVVVDTHVARISGRLGLTTHTDPVKIEFDLMDLMPKSDWSDFCLRLIYFGRETCAARKPKCPSCPIKRHCPWPDKTRAQP
ncbi:MAG: endonuclease III [Desulfobacterales bacterium]|nr:endonuclease III [Desulfobacterales bacterium]